MADVRSVGVTTEPDGTPDPDGTLTDPDGTTEEGGSTPLGTPVDDTSPVVVGTGSRPEAPDALVKGKLVPVGNGALPVPAPETPETADDETGATVGKTLDKAGTTSVKEGSKPVPVPAPEIPELTGAGAVAGVFVGAGRIERGSEFERIVDNPTNRPVGEAGAAEETGVTSGALAAGTTEEGMPPVDATKAGVGVAALGPRAEETMEANGSTIGVLAGTTELGIPPVDATAAGSGVGVDDAATRGISTEDATEANGSTTGVLAAGVFAGIIELGRPPVDATAAGSAVGVEEAATRGATTEDAAEAKGSTIGMLAGTIELGNPPVEATAAGF